MRWPTTNFFIRVNATLIFPCLICGLCIKWFIATIISVRPALSSAPRSVVPSVVIMVCPLYDGNSGTALVLTQHLALHLT